MVDSSVRTDSAVRTSQRVYGCDLRSWDTLVGMVIRDSWANLSLPATSPIALICPELITWTADKFEQLIASEARARPTDYLNIEASRAVRYLVSSGWRGTAVVLGEGGELLAGALLEEREPRWVIVRVHDVQDAPNGMSANVTVECEPK